MSSHEQRPKLSKVTSTRILPKGSSFKSLNPNRFKSQFYGCLARNELEKKQAQLKREVMRLNAQMMEIQNQVDKMDGGVVEEDSDDDFEDDMDPLAMTDHEFDSVFEPEEMRCLALVAHNHMKPAMQKFVLDNKNVLKKFRLTGTNTTMTMLHKVFGDDPSVRYGPTCQSGPLGGDAELVALMCMEELGGMIFLQDPMDAHPHSADIDCLNRQAMVHDVLLACNPTSAYGMTAVFRLALRKGKKGLIPSFFQTEYSPGVAEYIRRVEEAPSSASFINMKMDISLPKSEARPKERNKEMEKMEREGLKSYRESVSSKSPFSASILGIDVENKAHKRMASMAGSTSVGLSKRNLSELEDIFDDENYDFEEEEENIEDVEIFTEVKDREFYSHFLGEEMRCLALLAHDHMQPALKEFIHNNKNLLKKFRLTGSRTTMSMLHEVYGDDPMIRYGPSCQAGSLGGDAQLCALMCMDELGGMVFFQDPMEAHPHQVDIDCLNRQAQVHDIFVASNPSSAHAMMTVLRGSLKKGNKARISSFFETKKSPSVAEYKRRQKAVLDANIAASDKTEEPVSPAPVETPVPDLIANKTTSKDKKKPMLRFQFCKTIDIEPSSEIDVM